MLDRRRSVPLLRADPLEDRRDSWCIPALTVAAAASEWDTLCEDGEGVCWLVASWLERKLEEAMRDWCGELETEGEREGGRELRSGAIVVS